MTYIPDLAPMSYTGLKGPIRAVGWLESSNPFSRGSVEPEFSQRLMALIERPVWGFFSRGMHWCSICAAEGKSGPDYRSSQAVLLIPASHCVYETPIWIGHYVLGHSYRPPSEFCRAVISCPEPGSAELRSALVAHLPELSRLAEGRAPFFAEWADGAQQTLQSSPEYGSEESTLNARVGVWRVSSCAGHATITTSSIERAMELLPIQTARLTLRRFTTDDLEAFQAYRSDPVLAQYQAWEPVSDEQARVFLAAQAQQELGAAGHWLQVAVTRRDTYEVIGDLGLCVVDESVGVVKLGYTVAQRAQGRGYATEAVRGVLGALLGRGRARSVMAVTDVRNVASVALLRRIGFGHEGTKAAMFRGETCQEHTFVLTDEQWAAAGRLTRQ